MFVKKRANPGQQWISNIYIHYVLVLKTH